MPWKRRSRHSIEERSSYFDLAVEFLLIALFAFMPLCFGVVESWSELVVISIVAAAWLCVVVKHIVRADASWIFSWAQLPVVIFLLIVVAQLVPLPAGFVHTISPATESTKSRLLGDMPNAQNLLRSMTLSFYPNATAHALRLLIVAAAVFVIVLDVYRSSAQIRRLLTAIALIGGVIAIIALAQQLSGARAIYWKVPLDTLALGGPFVNRNHYAQFMNLSLGAALALLLAPVNRARGSRPHGVEAWLEWLRDPRNRLTQVLALIFVFGSVSVFLSMSRGGMLAFLIAMFVTVVVQSRRKQNSGLGWRIAGLGLLVLTVLLYFGFDAAYERLGTLRSLENASVGRAETNRDIVTKIAPKFPLWGLGLGTHEVVYPMFSRTNIPLLATHVENEYLQALEEVGGIGLAVMIAFIAIVIYTYVHTVRGMHRSIHPAAYGLGFAILAVLVHSATDFGQRLPANAAITASFCALLIALRRLPQRNSSTDDSAPPLLGGAWKHRLLGGAALLVSLPICYWTIGGAARASVAESHWKRAYRLEAQLAQKSWQGADAEFAQLITEAGAAVTAQPKNAHYRHWLNVYRWYAISQNLTFTADKTIVPQSTYDFAGRIIEELNGVRVLCPTFGPAYSLIGQIELFVLGRPSGAEHIRRGLELAPADATTVFLAARLDCLEGKLDQAESKLRRSIALGYSAGEVLRFCLSIDQPEMAIAAAGDDPEMLLAAADLLQAAAKAPELAASARQRAREILAEQAKRPGVAPAVLASIAEQHFRDGDFAAAVEFYQRAVNAQYDNVEWRLHLAQSLWKDGKPQDAIREARICLRLRPQMSAAEKLIADASVASPNRSPK